MVYRRYNSETVAGYENYVAFEPIIEKKHEVFDVDIVFLKVYIALLMDDELEVYLYLGDFKTTLEVIIFLCRDVLVVIHVIHNWSVKYLLYMVNKLLQYKPINLRIGNQFKKGLKCIQKFVGVWSQLVKY